jgi:hypothetical protein
MIFRPEEPHSQPILGSSEDKKGDLHAIMHVRQQITIKNLRPKPDPVVYGLVEHRVSVYLSQTRLPRLSESNGGQGSQRPREFIN